MTFDGAFELFGHFATQVGFEKTGLPAFDQAPEIPESSTFWVSRYAHILVITSEASEETVRTTARKGQEWLDLSCIAEERRSGAVIDGYLLILLSGTPDKSLETLIRELELDPTACRKHFAWPVDSAIELDLVWARIFRVTAIGFPKSPESMGMTGSPLLDTPLQRKLLEDIKELKGRNAARQHAENPSLAPDA